MLLMKAIAIFGFVILSFAANAFQNFNMENYAVSVNKFILFPDSSFYDQSNIAISEGETFQVIGETVLYHEDDSQTQKFKWYNVQLRTGQKGWVLGNNIAVFEDITFEDSLLDGSKAKLSFNYYGATVWQAAIIGFDANSATKKPYVERYLVFTNASRQSRYVQIGREQVEGKSWVSNVQMADLTNDGYDEIVIQLNSQGTMSETINQYLEIFTMRNDAFRSIYSEKINLGKSSKNIAPINQKFFDVEDGSIRVAYIDYFDCSDSYGGSCMEYVTYTYAWDKGTNKFETLYEPSRTSPILKPKYDNLNLFPGPGLYQTVGKVGTRETLKVIGQEVKFYRLGNDVTKKVFFLVKTFDGKKGYIESTNVEFIENDYNKALNSYYQRPSLNINHYDKDIMAVQLKDTSI